MSCWRGNVLLAMYTLLDRAHWPSTVYAICVPLPLLRSAGFVVTPLDSAKLPASFRLTTVLTV